MNESDRTQQAPLTASQQRFLRLLAQETRQIADPVAVLDLTAKMLGQHLRVTCCVFRGVTPDNTTFSIREDWCAPHFTRATGAATLDRFGPSAVDELRAGRTVVVSDIQEVVDFDTPDKAHWGAARAFICVPLVQEDTLRAIWCVQQDEPRDWMPDEVALVEAVADRSWAHAAHMSAVAALSEAQASMKVAVTAAKLGQWHLDLRTSVMTSSDGCKANFGRPPEDPFTYQDLHASIHPGDRDRVIAQIRTSIEKHTDYDTEYRNIWPDGSVHSVMVRGRASYLPDGTPVSMNGVTLDITERQRLEEVKAEGEREVQRLLLELQDHDRRKDEFLAMLSHELRNPMAPIFNALGLLRSQENASAHTRQAHAIIERQAGQLKRLVDELLEVSRITSGRVQLRQDVFTIDAVVAQSVETCQSVIDRHRHRLTVSLPENAIWVMGDAARLEQVMVNLLNNAAKYTPEGGTISLAVSAEQGELALRVRDSGVGISPDLLPRVFDLFTQAEKSLARSEGGLGIGLALVKRLVELHGGRVDAVSTPGQGSEFTVWLPVSRAEPQFDPGETMNRKSAGGRRVLVVDDNVDSALSMAQLLEMSDYEVRTAHDGPEALEVAERWKPDAVVLDIGLPTMSGYDVARRLRQSPELKNVKLVALTGYGQGSDRDKTREAGFDHHLVKPADLEQLQKALETD